MFQRGDEVVSVWQEEKPISFFIDTEITKIFRSLHLRTGGVFPFQLTE